MWSKTRFKPRAQYCQSQEHYDDPRGDVVTYLPLPDDHSLVITPEDGLPAMCDCGETFEGGPEMQAAAWRDHVEVEGLKMAARASAIAEHVARAAWRTPSSGSSTTASTPARSATRSDSRTAVRWCPRH